MKIPKVCRAVAAMAVAMTSSTSKTTTTVQALAPLHHQQYQHSKQLQHTPSRTSMPQAPQHRLETERFYASSMAIYSDLPPMISTSSPNASYQQPIPDVYFVDEKLVKQQPQQQRRRRMHRPIGQGSRVVVPHHNAPANTMSSSCLTSNQQHIQIHTSSGRKAVSQKRDIIVRINGKESTQQPVSHHQNQNHKQSPFQADIEQCSFQIRQFRMAVRIRDDLAQQYKQQQLEEIFRKSTSTSTNLHSTSSTAVPTEMSSTVTSIASVPTEAVWASACGISVMQLRRIMHQGQQARTELVAAHVGLVTNIAKRHYHALKQALEAGGGLGTILALQDMIQEGNLGLMEAAERFKPEKGFQFSTYATYWIRQRILRAISDSSRTIRLPAHVHSMLHKMQRAKKEIKSELGRDPSIHELAQFLEVPAQRLQKYAASSRNVVSLERPLRGAQSTKEDRRTLGDTLASDIPTPLEDVEADYLRRDIRAVMDTALAEKERQVIIRRFGLEDGKPRTLEETAQLLGITRDRVRLVEARALNKLRHPQRNYRLKEYVQMSSTTSSSDNSAAGGIAYGAFSLHNDQNQELLSRSNIGTPPGMDRIWFF